MYRCLHEGFDLPLFVRFYLQIIFCGTSCPVFFLENQRLPLVQSPVETFPVGYATKLSKVLVFLKNILCGGLCPTMDCVPFKLCLYRKTFFKLISKSLCQCWTWRQSLNLFMFFLNADNLFLLFKRLLKFSSLLEIDHIFIILNW